VLQSLTVSEVVLARAQMAISLAFHIVFAAVGIAMPLLMVVAEVLWRRTGDAEYLALARRWAKGTAVFFAIGAVSGTVLSFELGLLFPEFMRWAGALIGLPFSLEGFAFFTEAIFLGLYLYGWERLPPAAHIASGVVVALSGLASAVFVTIANAWMNAPTGFRLEGGRLVDIDPLRAMASPFVAHEVLHTALAAYMATTLAVGAIHAYALLRGPATSFHRRALAIALGVTIPCSLVQPLVGHFAGGRVAEHQPLKLAAMEGLRQTTRGAAAHLGPIAIPGGLSLLAYGSFDAEVKGLEEFPRADWPHRIVNVSFQAMVLLGTLAAGYAALTAFLWWRRRRLPDGAWWLWTTLLLGPCGVLAMEAGWFVTEVGRQPWVIYGVLRTSDAVTPMTGLAVPLVTFSAVYLGLGGVVAAVLARQVRQTT